MTHHTARRLLLLFCCTAYVLALGAVWLWVFWALAVAAGLIGPAIAFIIANEPSTAETVEEGREDGIGSRAVGARNLGARRSDAA